MCSIYQHTHTHTHTHTHSEKPPFTSAHKSLMAKNLTGVCVCVCVCVEAQVANGEEPHRCPKPT